MKFSTTSLLALAASALAAPLEESSSSTSNIEARADKQQGPFYLKVTGKNANPSIDGYFASYHSGAAINTLGYIAGPLPAKNQRDSYEFYFNTTQNANGAVIEGRKAGNLIYKLPVNNGEMMVDLVAHLQCGPGSNTCVVVQEPGRANYADNGFLADGSLFTPVYFDDSENTPTTAPRPGSPTADAGSWVLCWQYYGSYYYRSLAYALSFPTTNPTCRPVNVKRVNA